MLKLLVIGQGTNILGHKNRGEGGHVSQNWVSILLTRLSFSLWTLRSKIPYLDFSVNVSVHIRTKDLVARGFKITQLLRAEIYIISRKRSFLGLELG